MKKILIFGGAGFIGYHLSKKLSHNPNNKIVILDNFSRGKEDEELKKLAMKENVDVMNFDITNAKEFDKINGTHYDEVYLLAAVNGTKNFYEIPDQVLRVNVIGTYNVINWFCKSKSAKLLFTSSSEAYAGTKHKKIPTPEETPLTIEDVFNPRWTYAGSKMIGEIMVINFCKRYGKRFTIVRPHNFYGSRMGYEHVMPEFILRVKNKENPFKIYGANCSRSFCYIDDATEAITLLMQSEKADGQIYHIGTQDEIQMIQLAFKICELMNYETKFETHSAPKGSTKRRCPNTTKLELLGWKPKIKLEEGLKETIKWYTK